MCIASEATPGGVALDVKADPCPVAYGASPVVHDTNINNRSRHCIGDIELLIEFTNDMFDTRKPRPVPNAAVQALPRRVKNYKQIASGLAVPNSFSCYQTASAVANQSEEIATTLTFDPSLNGQQKIALCARYFIPI